MGGSALHDEQGGEANGKVGRVALVNLWGTSRQGQSTLVGYVGEVEKCGCVCRGGGARNVSKCANITYL